MHDTDQLPRSTRDAPPALTHRPALDGLRGLAVAVVLAFHLGFGWAKGGYLGVSVFFTLSGFLITTLLLAERGATGRTDLKRFWSRRARRLLPAAAVGLVLAALVARALPRRSDGVKLDMLAALGDVANWRLLVSGRSYASLFTNPSPVLHYWSLSIEEQFYALYPLLVVVALRGRRNVRRLLRWCAVGTMASWVALVGAGLTGHHDLAYYSTVTRAGELLAGAMLAMVLRLRAQRPATAVPHRARPLLEAASLVGIVALCATIPESSRALELGVLPLVAVLSTVVIGAAFRGGALAVVLAWRPLAALGRISYGVYVYHWPLLLLLTSDRVGMSGTQLAAVRIAATLGIAIASYFLIERPVRRGHWPRPVVAWRVVPAGFALTALAVAVLVPNPDPSRTIDFSAASAAVSANASSGQADRQLPATIVPGGALRIATFGDSTALMVNSGLAHWGQSSGELEVVFGLTLPGCGLLPGLRRFQGEVHEPGADCVNWRTTWAAKLQSTAADVAVILLGPWDIADHKLPGDDSWQAVGDDGLDAALRKEMSDAADLLLTYVPRVVWLTSPDIDDGLGNPDVPEAGFGENDPARMHRYNELVKELAAHTPGVRVVDLNEHLASLPGGEMDVALRPDGVHFSNQSTDVVAPWIGGSIVAAARAS
ncbi:MAG: acyltransferase family protein [Acidimicrobiales bacterium]